MKSGIFLHIGLHKTGTTTLQRFFAHNEKAFNDHGFFFPKACRENKPDQIIHSNLSWELLNHGMFDPALGTFSGLRDEIAEAPPDRNWIISGEGLSRLAKPSKLLKHFEGHPLTIIVYVRDPVEAAPSLYSEQLKAGCVDTFNPWIVRKSTRWLNHDQILTPWRQAVERLIQMDHSQASRSWLGRITHRRADVRIIERSLEPGRLHKASLVDDFISIIAPGCELSGLSEPFIQHHNHRISTLECVALLFINGIQLHAPPICDKEAVQQRNEARRIVRTAFPHCTKSFENTARQRLLLTRVFSKQDLPIGDLPESGSGEVESPALLREVIRSLEPLVPHDLPTGAMEEVHQRVARFLAEQGGVYSLCNNID